MRYPLGGHSIDAPATGIRPFLNFYFYVFTFQRIPGISPYLRRSLMSVRLSGVPSR